MNEEIIKSKDKIIKYKSNKKVVPSGNGAIIYVPKDLIGKIVEVNYQEEK